MTHFKKVPDSSDGWNYAKNYRKAGRRPLSPFRGGDECRTLSSQPIAIYPLGYI